MPQRDYATANDYGQSPYSDDSTPAAPELVKLLRRASSHIEGLTASAMYDVDSDGYPVDIEIAEAFRDATCAQAAYWLETGDVSGAVASSGSMGIGSVSLGATKSEGRTPADKQASRHAPEALEILTNAGLTSGVPMRR